MINSLCIFILRMCGKSESDGQHLLAGIEMIATMVIVLYYTQH